eukprot:4377258-Pyramimonas_sp.AAC.1
MEKVSWRRTQAYAVAGSAIDGIGFDGAPFGIAKRVRGVPTWVRWFRASAAKEGFGGAPYGATKRVRGVPKWARWCHASAAIG